MIFQIYGKKNTQCIIFVAKNAYSIDIENLDIKLNLYKDFWLSFDSTI